MNESTLPFDLSLPDHPILLDVQSLATRFHTVVDHRAARGVRYPLPVILTIAVLAKLAGANQIRAVAEWAWHRQDELAALFGLERSTMPHPTTWSRILGGAVEVGAKENEISAAPRLLQQLDLRGVWSVAMRCVPNAPCASTSSGKAGSISSRSRRTSPRGPRTSTRCLTPRWWPLLGGRKRRISAQSARLTRGMAGSRNARLR